MATINTTWLSWYSYFEELAALNKLIRHTPGKDTTRFFASTLESFITDAHNMLPAAQGPCVWLIEPARTIGGNNGNNADERDVYEGMFFILEAVKNGDKTAELTAKNRTDVVVNQFIARIKHDSANNHTLWSRSMDRTDSIRIMPYSKPGTFNVVGKQVSFRSPQFFNYCYQQSDWL